MPEPIALDPAEQAAVTALLARIPAREHGPTCRRWTHRASANPLCDCWQLTKAVETARVAVHASLPADRKSVV